MKPGQIQQLRDLVKCYMPVADDIKLEKLWWCMQTGFPLNDRDKKTLRRLTHQYRHQIKAIKRNQV